MDADSSVDQHLLANTDRVSSRARPAGISKFHSEKWCSIMSRILIMTLIISWSLPTFAADYYWVGGDGDWNDLSNWATASGGTINYPVIPGADDNVFFDENSFTAPGQVVRITAGSIFCRNMDWSAATFEPTLRTATPARINLFGSIILHPDMTFDVRGEILLVGEQPDMVIDAAGQDFPGTLCFKSPGGNYLLNADLRVDSLIDLQEGVLDLTEHTLETGFFRADRDQATLRLGSGLFRITANTIYVPGALSLATPTVDINSNILDIEPDQGRIEITGRFVEFWVVGQNTLQVNELIFSNPDGRIYLGRRWRAEFFEMANLTFAGRMAFAGDAILDMPFRGGVLSLTPGKSYTLRSGENFTITGLEAPGTCEAPISLSASIGGQEAILFSNMPTIEGTFLSLRDIRSSGIADFIARDGIDLGGNDGWTFTGVNTLDLYWVGGTGNWSDPANWALTSGSPGGACVPNGNTNVFFDNNSFNGPGQTVTVDVSSADCRDFTWQGVTGNPVWIAPEVTQLRVFGSFRLAPNMTWNQLGEVLFQSNTTGQQITTAGQTLDHLITFDGPNGEWTFQDTFRMGDDILELTNGHLITNDQYLGLEGFYARNGQSARLTLGNSVIEIRNVAPVNGWYVENTTLDLDAGTSLILAVGSNFNFSHQNTPGSFQYHHISSSSNTNIFHSLPDDSLRVQRFDLGNRTNINSSLHIDTLIIRPDLTVLLQAGKQLTVNQIETPGDCSTGGSIIRSDRLNRSAFISSTQAIILDKISLRDLHTEGGGTFSVQNGLDMGGNQGWMFANSGRTLYWVGNGGNWHDPDHWSLSSGGPGGECIPTLADNVIFDENAFDQPNQFVTVTGGREIACRNMDWRNVDENPSFSTFITNIGGSVWATPNADIFMDLTYFLGPGNNEFAPYEQDFRYLYVQNSGTLDLLTDHRYDSEFSGFNIFAGTVRFNDHRVDMGSIASFDNFNAVAPARIDLGNAYIRLSGAEPLTYYVNNITEMDAGTSTIEITHPESRVVFLRDISGITPRLHRVLATNNDNVVTTLNHTSTQQGDKIEAQYVEIYGNGATFGNWSIDSLVISPGKSYVFRSRADLCVNRYLRAIANNCLSIEIGSGENGTPGNLIMPDTAEIVADFLQMRDISASGGADFFAGNNSTDIGGNSGWTFGTPQDLNVVGFLGPDQLLCDDNSLVTLSAENRSPGETYQWNTGATTATINVNTPGIYTAEVNFPANNCRVRDTIQVLDAESFVPDLPNDTSICRGEQLLLDANTGVSNVNYAWDNGTTDPTLLVEQTGTYRITLTQANCVVQDSVALSVLDFPAFQLGSDTLVCDTNAVVDLDLTGLAADYQWQDGATTATYQIDTGGVYWLEASNGNCATRDSIEVRYLRDINLDLGGDRTACEGATITLRSNLAQADYLWQDGSRADSLTVTDSGTYRLEATVETCPLFDSVAVDFLPLPTFELGDDRSICSGDSIQLDGTSSLAGATYQWRDGVTGPVRQVKAERVYHLTASRGGCDFTDSVALALRPIPAVDLGPDQTRCTGETQLLEAGISGDQLTWQDGSTEPTFEVTGPGIYFLDVTENGCTGTDTVVFTYNPLPVFELGADETICAGDSLVVTAAVPGATFSWQDNGATDPTRVLQAAGTYSLEALLNGCTFSDSITLNTVAPPDPDLGDDPEGCTGETIILTPAGAAGSYLWQDGSTSPQLPVKRPGTYWVNLAEGPCQTSDTVTVTFFPTPTVDLGPDQTLCDGESFLLDASNSGGAFFFWQDGTVEPRLRVTTPGTYWVEAERNGCVDRDSVRIDFLQLTDFDLGPDTVACDVNPITLTAPPINGSFRWSTGSTSSQIQVAESGLYWLEVADPCPARDSIRITLRECIPFQAYFPNAFSPNDDGVNDEFRPFLPGSVEIIDVELQIFDRWGNRIYATDNLDEGWNGRYQGELAERGIYIWYLQISYIDDFGQGTAQESGEVLLAR